MSQIGFQRVYQNNHKDLLKIQKFEEFKKRENLGFQITVLTRAIFQATKLRLERVKLLFKLPVNN